MLKLEKVSKYYSQGGMVSTGFSKVDLELNVGEFVAITGESGSGKSTLLNVISGLDSYEEGEMYVNGEATSGFLATELEEYRKKYIGNIFQTFNLINSYTVYQNVELILLTSGYKKAEIKEKVDDIIEKVGLTEYRNTKASKLSGGQKQRVAIARALAKETPIIVADEPTGNLDTKSAADIIALLNQLSKDRLIIIVTHNYDQVEEYVTRKITMHDGKIVEDKQLAESRETETGEVMPARADDLSKASTLRLGTRNAFNIPSKFILLLIVFTFMCIGIISPYASIMNMGDSLDGGYNYYFRNTSKNRIIVTKTDRSVFTKDDYRKLAEISNIENIVENDLIMDLTVNIIDEKNNGDFYITGKFAELSDFEGRLEEGRMPKKKNEVILMMPENGYAAMVIPQVFDNKVRMCNDNTGAEISKESIKVVGYGFLTSEEEEGLTNGYWAETYICTNEKTMREMRFAALERYCSQEIEFDGTIVEGNSGQGLYTLRPSDKVLEGEVYIPESISVLSDKWAIYQNLRLTNKSLYFEDKYKFYVGAVYNAQTFQYYLGTDEYDKYAESIFLNPKDYRKIFDKKNFQSSVITKDDKLTGETADAIRAAGYNTFVVSDGLVSYSEGADTLLEVLRIFLFAGVLTVLFFVTYFIVRLILKSRNTYFSTIRMLGATRANCNGLLRTELFVVFNIAFVLSSGLTLLAKEKIIPCAEYLRSTLDYLKPTDFAILYALLFAISMLIAMRYSKALFKNSVMNVHREEV